MPEINLVDRSLQDYYNETELSIQVSPGGFSFCIYTTHDALIRAFRYYKFTNAVLREDILNHVNDILNRDDLLRLPQKQVKVIFTGRKSTMIPNEFFQPEQLKTLLEFNHPLEDLEEIHYNEIPFCNSYISFAIPSYFASMVTAKFTNAAFFNQASPLLLFAGELIAKEQNDCVLINLNKEFFDILVVQNNALKFINTFLYVNSVDLLYFILYVCKQLKIDARAIPFYLTGEESTDDNLIAELSNFIADLSTPPSLEDLKLADSLKDIDTARHFPLLYLLKCE